jgi:AraC-like DNA-binding protein
MSMDGLGVAAAAVEPSQTFRERPPTSHLRGLVSCVWIQQVGQASPPYLHRTIPNGSTELVCTLGSLPTIAGPQMGPTEQVVAPGTVTIGVRFRPAVAPALLALPASELVDLEVDAGEIWGRSANALAESLAATSSPQAAAVALERELIRRTRDRAPLDPLATEAVTRLLRRQGGVRSLARSLYISERQLRRRFEAAVGVAPKALERMFRFQRFLALMHADDEPRPSLGRLAREAGYADQAHLTREAVRLAGRTPGTLLQHADHDCRCAHDHTASFRAFL